MKKRWLCVVLAVVLVASLLPATALATGQTTDMKVSEQFIEVLKKMEGFYAYAQWDYAQWTVGYGTKCPDDKLEYWKKNPITVEEALELLYAELPDYEIPVNNFIRKHGLTVTQNQYDALVSVSYNCGTAWLGEVDGYLNTAVRMGDMGTALIYGFCLHSTAGGDYILQRRRLSEANMYINGEYKSYTEGNSYPANFKYLFLDGNGGAPKYAIHGYDSDESSPIITDFKDIPTGVDGEGKWFVYEFAGWFTEPVGGTQITNLDGSLKNGTILYAQWKNPQGEIVSLPKGEAVDNLQINVLANVNVRNGPGTYYPVNETLSASADAPLAVTITETFTASSTTWGRIPQGWISLNYTNYEDVINAIPDDSFPKAATVQRNKVKIRNGPGTSYTHLGYKNKGDKITVVEERLESGNLWGKMDDGNWICLDYKGDAYAIYDSDVTASLVSVQMLKLPDKLQYVQKYEELSILGSVVVATYSDGSLKARTVARENTDGFDNTQVGEKTVTVYFAGGSTTFEVEIVSPTVTFLNYDGSVLTTQQYAYGAEVNAPGVPTRPEDDAGSYVFKGWDKEITPCYGNAVYTAVFELIPVIPEYIPGDINGDLVVNKEDAFHLLYSLVWGQEEYPLKAPADFDKNGIANKEDAFYLLYHLVWGAEEYPLTN